jgi:hypothetical protein
MTLDTQFFEGVLQDFKQERERMLDRLSLGEEELLDEMNELDLKIDIYKQLKIKSEL